MVRGKIIGGLSAIGAYAGRFVDNFASGRRIRALYAAGACASSYVVKRSSELLPKISGYIEQLTKYLWERGERVREKAESVFGLYSELEIRFKDGSKIPIKNDPETQLISEIEVPFKFSEKWLNSGLGRPGTLETAEVAVLTPNPENNWVMSGRSVVGIFKEIVPYEKGLELRHMENVRFKHEAYQLAGIFLFALSVYNLYRCRHPIKEDLGRFWNRLYETRFTIRT